MKKVKKMAFGGLGGISNAMNNASQQIPTQSQLRGGATMGGMSGGAPMRGGLGMMNAGRANRLIADRSNLDDRRMAKFGPGRPMPQPLPAPTNTATPVTKQTVSGAVAPNYGTTIMKKGGKVSSASKRADGIAKKGKTKGRIV